MHPDVIGRLRAAVGAGAVLTEPAALRAYECDGLTGHRAVPAAVVLPLTTEETAAAVRILHGAGIPYVASIPAAPWEECHYGYMTGRRGLYRIPQTAVYARRILYVDRGLRYADAVAVQRSTAVTMLRHAPWIRSRLFFWEMGMDAGSFPAEGARDDGFILYVGRLEHSKGVDTLLQAVAGLPDRVVVAGTGSQAAALKAMATPNVEFLGEVPEDHLRELYRTASMAVFPSRFEGFGLVALEALSSGTPTAVTSGYGFRLIPPASDWVEWFAPGDAVGCRAAIERLRGRKTPAWSRAAHEMVATHHHHRDRVRELVQLYESLVAGQGVPPSPPIYKPGALHAPPHGRAA